MRNIPFPFFWKLVEAGRRLEVSLQSSYIARNFCETRFSIRYLLKIISLLQTWKTKRFLEFPGNLLWREGARNYHWTARKKLEIPAKTVFRFHWKLFFGKLANSYFPDFSENLADGSSSNIPLKSSWIARHSCENHFSMGQNRLKS